MSEEALNNLMRLRRLERSLWPCHDCDESALKELVNRGYAEVRLGPNRMKFVHHISRLGVAALDRACTERGLPPVIPRS